MNLYPRVPYFFYEFGEIFFDPIKLSNMREFRENRCSEIHALLK